jgi:hypothetical protein
MDTRTSGTVMVTRSGVMVKKVEDRGGKRTKIMHERSQSIQDEGM